MLVYGQIESGNTNGAAAVSVFLLLISFVGAARGSRRAGGPAAARPPRAAGGERPGPGRRGRGGGEGVRLRAAAQPRARVPAEPEGPGRPPAELGGAVPARAAARRGPPLRHHLPSQAPARAELPERARGDPRDRRGAEEGAPASLRLAPAREGGVASRSCSGGRVRPAAAKAVFDFFHRPVRPRPTSRGRRVADEVGGAGRRPWRLPRQRSPGRARRGPSSPTPSPRRRSTPRWPRRTGGSA